MNPPIEKLYVVSLEEILWGGILVAITMAIHVIGIYITLRINNSMKSRLANKGNIVGGLIPLILASCMILSVHLAEIMIWAMFFSWTSSFPNLSTSFYFALNEYTTVGSRFNLPYQWRLLEGIIALAGLLAFAISTGTLFGLAKSFLDQPFGILRKRSVKRTA